MSLSAPLFDQRLPALTIVHGPFHHSPAILPAAAHHRVDVFHCHRWVLFFCELQQVFHIYKFTVYHNAVHVKENGLDRACDLHVNSFPSQASRGCLRRSISSRGCTRLACSAFLVCSAFFIGRKLLQTIRLTEKGGLRISRLYSIVFPSILQESRAFSGSLPRTPPYHRRKVSWC